MSALGGGLNGSTQHFILEGKDGVYSEGSAISSRFRSGREGGAVKSLAERGSRSKRSDGRLVSRHLPFIAKQPCMGGDLTQVLRRPVELAVISRHFAMRQRCPLYPQSGHSRQRLTASLHGVGIKPQQTGPSCRRPRARGYGSDTCTDGRDQRSLRIR